MPARKRSSRLILLAFACSTSACYLDNPGDVPPEATLYFPNALALSQAESGEASRYLFVANSNFDLRYSAGTLQALDLDRLGERLAECAEDREAACAADRAADCKRACAVDVADVLAGEVRIGSYSNALAVSADGNRVLLATRTDQSLTVVAFDPDADPWPDGSGVLRCPGGEPSPCKLAELGTDRRAEDEAELEWPSEPSTMLTGRLADFDDTLDVPEDADEYALVSHFAGQLSLFVERGGDLVLTDVLPSGAPIASSLAFDPVTRFVYATLGDYAGGFPLLSRLRVVLPADGDDPEAHAYLSQTSQFQVTTSFSNPRDIVFLPAFEDASFALSTPSALVAVANPSGLLLTDLPEQGDEARPGRVRLKDLTVLGPGATRLSTAVVDSIPIAVVASFDAREVSVVDLRTMRTRSVQPNLSGPFEVVIDGPRRLVYLTDFRSSVLRVIDLAEVLTGDTAGSVAVVATIGTPRVIQELR